MQLFEAAEIRASKVGLKPDVPLVRQGLDSLDMITLLHQVELAYDVVVSDERAAHLRTLDDIVAFLNSADAPRGPSTWRA
ncbi:MAG TPA: phosphopantetheine-binding protein [Kofleriaceae bacterium]|nr:phosphopantetheine-binding protein [Kofleriaceae bacterium]